MDNPHESEHEPDPALNHELPSSFALCCRNDEVAHFATLKAAQMYARLEFDSYCIVLVQTGEIVVSKCLHQNS